MVVNFRGYQGSEQDTVSTANKNMFQVSNKHQVFFWWEKTPSIFMNYGIFTRLISHKNMIDEICHINITVLQRIPLDRHARPPCCPVSSASSRIPGNKRRRGTDRPVQGFESEIYNWKTGLKQQ
jgi:hypothetical protein